jgi:hypothetical protein
MIRFSSSDGPVPCTAYASSCTPARPGSLVRNASLDVLRRTRRNADTIIGAAPDMTGGHPAAVRVGARPYQRISIVESNDQTQGLLRRNAAFSSNAALLLLLGSAIIWLCKKTKAAGVAAAH